MTHINEARELLDTYARFGLEHEGSHYNKREHAVEAISDAIAQRDAALTASQEQQAEIEKLTKELAVSERSLAQWQRLATENKELVMTARSERDTLRKDFDHLYEDVQTVVAERDRYKAALDKADDLFMDNGTISAAEYKIIETGKAIRQALSPVQGGE